MTNLVSTVGIVVAVASLLFSGWQARMLARQTALQNATAGMSTLQQLFTWLHHVQGLVLNDSRLLPHFQGGALVELSPEDTARLRWIAAMYCDVLNIGLHEQQTITSTRSLREWRNFCSQTLQKSLAIRDEVTAKRTAYPLLAELLDELPTTPALNV